MSSKVIMLRPPSIKDEGNYIEFIEQAKDDYCETNGDVGLCLTTMTDYMPPHVTLADYTPEAVEVLPGEEEQPAFTNASILKRRDAFIERRDKTVAENRIKLKTMFKSLLKRCTTESRSKIKDHAGNLWLAAETTNDTISLIKWMKESHLTAVFGVSPALKCLNQESLKKRMDSLVQGENESVTDFGQKYKNLKAAYEGAGGATCGALQETLNFLGKLTSHYEPLTRDMANKAMRGDLNAYPETLDNAIFTVSHWIPAAKDVTHQAFIADAIAKSRNKPEKQIKEKVTTDNNQKLRDAKKPDQRPKCTHCSKVGHTVETCWHKKKHDQKQYENAMAIVANYQKKSANSKSDSKQSTADSDEDEWDGVFMTTVLPDTDEDNMPALVSDSESESDDEDVFKGYRKMTTKKITNTKRADENPVGQNIKRIQDFFFSAVASEGFNNTWIGLDTMSSLDIFKEKNLLDNLKESSRTLKLGGVNSKSECLTITQQGMFDGIEVRYHPTVACNILSFSNRIKSGDSITFIDSANLFILVPKGSCTVYKFRSSKAAGSNGQFYMNTDQDRKVYSSNDSARKVFMQMKRADLTVDLDTRTMVSFTPLAEDHAVSLRAVGVEEKARDVLDHTVNLRVVGMNSVTTTVGAHIVSLEL
jgi:hypothetical protein